MQKAEVMDEPRKKEDIRHTENKQQNNRYKYYLTSNYIKCKWIEHSNFKRQTLIEQIFKT